MPRLNFWKVWNDMIIACIHFNFIYLDKQALPNPNNAIVIKNSTPESWSGQKYDISIYKGGQPFVVEESVHTGDQIDFTMKPVLYFAVTRNLKEGSNFRAIEVTSISEAFNLSEFPNGLKVTLSMLPTGGKYEFTGQELA